MSTGPLGGIAASAAGLPLAQTKGADVQRTQHERASQERQVQNDRRAENAAGIGETDGENHQPAERDADGRRPWEQPPRQRASGGSADGPPRQSKDASGQTGNLLDLSG
jgi:hypothetical protein